MGTIQVRNQDTPNQFKQNIVTKLDLKVDVNKQISPYLKQLCHWSFQQIKQAYTAYQRKSQCPYIDWFLMMKILPFQKPTCKIIFQYFSGDYKYVCIYQLICALVLLSYHTYKRKMQFIYMIFDFQHKKSITIKQLMLIFQSMVNGYCRVTNQKLPDYQLLQKYSKQYFLRGNPSQIYKVAKLRRLIEQVQANSLINDLFNRFQHPELLQVYEDYMLYSQEGLKKYSSDQSEKIFRVIYKAYKDKDFQQVQLVQYNRQLRLGNRRYADFQKNYNLPVQNSATLQKGKSAGNIKSHISAFRSKSLAKLSPIKKKQKQKQKYETAFSNIKRNNTLNSNISNKAFGFSPLKSKLIKQYNPQKSFSIQKEQKDQEWNSPLISQKNKKNKKFLFLNHKTLSKRDMFQTISYFRTLSGNQEDIRVKQFFKSFEKKVFMKKQLTALFRVIDTNKNGQISFKQFLKILYPDITESDTKVVLKWKQDYFKTYYADSLQNNQLKANSYQNFNLLPKDAINRIKQIFKIIDTGNKGYLNYNDLVQSFKTGYTLRDCQNVIKQNGDANGRINFDSFVKMILPNGWVIEGYHNNNNVILLSALSSMLSK